MLGSDKNPEECSENQATLQKRHLTIGEFLQNNATETK
jgi:hypothetical protein